MATFNEIPRPVTAVFHVDETVIDGILIRSHNWSVTYNGGETFYLSDKEFRARYTAADADAVEMSIKALDAVSGKILSEGKKC